MYKRYLLIILYIALFGIKVSANNEAVDTSNKKTIFDYIIFSEQDKSESNSSKVSISNEVNSSKEDNGSKIADKDNNTSKVLLDNQKDIDKDAQAKLNGGSFCFDAKSYLSLKEIILPLPQDYAKTYLKLKTLANPAGKTVYVKIYKSRQRMYVYVDNNFFGSWRVSTARRGYWTPVGTYRPYLLERMHYSKKYHHSPMPWSIFFKGGYAIHGTRSIHRLGRPASHGCVRVHPRNARKLYKLIKRYGMHNTKIIIKG